LRILQKLSFALAIAAACAPAQTIAIINATVIDVASGKSEPDTTVVIQGNRIASVTRSAKPTPKADQVIDAKGEYLIPGLWDMHTHVYFDETSAEANDLVLPLYLANGVTGIRDMGSNLDLILHARTDIAAHRLFGPRMIVSGPMLDGPKSPYKTVIKIATPEDGRKAVDMLKSRGVDFIKVQSFVPREAYFAVAQESKKLGIEFEGHVPDAIRASEAVSAGQRSFEHLIGIFEASSPDEDKYLTGKKGAGAFLATYSPAREATIIQLLAKNQVWQCPTLFSEQVEWLVDVFDYNKDPDLPYAAHSWITKIWPAEKKSYYDSQDSDPLAVRQKFVTHELDIVKKLHAANVPLLAGTDAPPVLALIPGISLHIELQRFVAAGLTPLEALQTATLNPARFYNRLNDFGSVKTGRTADLVLLTANPLDNITNTRKIAGVIADGHYISQQDLDQLRAKLKTIAAAK